MIATLSSVEVIFNLSPGIVCLISLPSVREKVLGARHSQTVR